MNRKGIEFTFNWLFAIIVGAVIIFLAIYGATKLISVNNYQINTETAKALSIIFNPLETGIASGLKPGPISLNDEIRIYNKCDSAGVFGNNEISISSKNGLKWAEKSSPLEIPNKYVFSSEIEEGKIFFPFSKPFKMPFKISELIFISSKYFCFVNAPYEIEEDITSLGVENIKFENCTKKDVKVCFGSSCEISVYGDDYEGYVIKNRTKVYYTGNLLYAAIFSSPDIYECNVKRLMSRLAQLSYIYSDESDFLANKGCDSGLKSNLLSLAGAAKNLESSAGLMNPVLQDKVRNIEEQNSASICCLFDCG